MKVSFLSKEIIMKRWHELSTREMITLYYEKHAALRSNDFTKLLELRQRCPDIFIKRYDAEALALIESAKKFQTTTWYKKRLQLQMKGRLRIVLPDD